MEASTLAAPGTEAFTSASAGSQRLRSELGALAASAAARGDVELVHAIDPSYDSSKPLAVDGVPAALLGVIAQRGHSALLSRLIDLADSHAKLGSAGASLADLRPTLRASAKPPSAPVLGPVTAGATAADVERRLQVCVGAWLEAAILAGDDEAVSAMVMPHEWPFPATSTSRSASTRSSPPAAPSPTPRCRNTRRHSPRATYPARPSRRPYLPWPVSPSSERSRAPCTTYALRAQRGGETARSRAEPRALALELELVVITARVRPVTLAHPRPRHHLRQVGA